VNIRNTGRPNVEEYVYVDLMENVAILPGSSTCFLRAKSKKEEQKQDFV